MDESVVEVAEVAPTNERLAFSITHPTLGSISMELTSTFLGFIPGFLVQRVLSTMIRWLQKISPA